MITEVVLDMLFLIPATFYKIMPNLPQLPIPTVGDFVGLIELFSIADIFFPVGKMVTFLLAWVGISMLSMTKTFVEWLYKLIPLT